MIGGRASSLPWTGGLLLPTTTHCFSPSFLSATRKKKTFQLKIPGRENRVVSRWRQLPHCTCERWRGHLKAVITVNSLYFPPPSPPSLSTPLPGTNRRASFVFPPLLCNFGHFNLSFSRLALLDVNKTDSV